MTIAGCEPRTVDELILPGKHYILKCHINEDTKDKKKWRCVRLKLYNIQGQLLTSLQTGASDYSKWAVAWHPVNDTIILNSQDIGIYAYSIVNRRELQSVKVDKELDSLAKVAFYKKYN
ncbi:hypothetical protein BEL04_18425 [Mucilaginibacter sp. PPCGB 2223]|nr:hypothetical protein BEL04_18425 [Mucilaginibacter sp. PPCGB 2223]